jgi:microcystin-dependent protein
MSSPFLAEIRIVSFNFPPKGWVFCNGQTMAINQNQAIFSLLGTTYGGNGITTFQLPNLQGRAPLHFGNGFVLGETGGEENHTLQITEMPQHNHFVQAVTRPGTQQSAGSNFLAAHRGGYADVTDSAVAPGTLANAGGSQPHPNMPPYLVLNYVIALSGIFPSRS